VETLSAVRRLGSLCSNGNAPLSTALFARALFTAHGSNFSLKLSPNYIGSHLSFAVSSRRLASHLFQNKCLATKNKLEFPEIFLRENISRAGGLAEMSRVGATPASQT
jgi:hypothetical protein